MLKAITNKAHKISDRFKATKTYAIAEGMIRRFAETVKDEYPIVNGAIIVEREQAQACGIATKDVSEAKTTLLNLAAKKRATETQQQNALKNIGKVALNTLASRDSH
ncbi:MAG: hypothetical protein GY804_06335 [Alphaproteobacteria bacterium]|nr:hypothetical protein [Alphaproteobacteria bacterium]